MSQLPDALDRVVAGFDSDLECSILAPTNAKRPETMAPHLPILPLARLHPHVTAVLMELSEVIPCPKDACYVCRDLARGPGATLLPPPDQCVHCRRPVHRDCMLPVGGESPTEFAARVADPFCTCSLCAALLPRPSDQCRTCRGTHSAFNRPIVCTICHGTYHRTPACAGTSETKQNHTFVCGLCRVVRRHFSGILYSAALARQSMIGPLPDDFDEICETILEAKELADEDDEARAGTEQSQLLDDVLPNSSQSSAVELESASFLAPLSENTLRFIAAEDTDTARAARARFDSIKAGAARAPPSRRARTQSKPTTTPTTAVVDMAGLDEVSLMHTPPPRPASPAILTGRAARPQRAARQIAMFGLEGLSQGSSEAPLSTSEQSSSGLAALLGDSDESDHAAPALSLSEPDLGELIAAPPPPPPPPALTAPVRAPARRGRKAATAAAAAAAAAGGDAAADGTAIAVQPVRRGRGTSVTRTIGGPYNFIPLTTPVKGPIFETLIPQPNPDIPRPQPLRRPAETYTDRAIPPLYRRVRLPRAIMLPPKQRTPSECCCKDYRHYTKPSVYIRKAPRRPLPDDAPYPRRGRLLKAAAQMWVSLPPPPLRWIRTPRRVRPRIRGRGPEATPRLGAIAVAADGYLRYDAIFTDQCRVGQALVRRANAGRWRPRGLEKSQLYSSARRLYTSLYRRRYFVYRSRRPKPINAQQINTLVHALPLPLPIAKPRWGMQPCGNRADQKGRLRHQDPDRIFTAAPLAGAGAGRGRMIIQCFRPKSYHVRERLRVLKIFKASRREKIGPETPLLTRAETTMDMKMPSWFRPTFRRLYRAAMRRRRHRPRVGLVACEHPAWRAPAVPLMPPPAVAPVHEDDGIDTNVRGSTVLYEGCCNAQFTSDVVEALPQAVVPNLQQPAREIIQPDLHAVNAVVAATSADYPDMPPLMDVCDTSVGQYDWTESIIFRYTFTTYSRRPTKIPSVRNYLTQYRPDLVTDTFVDTVISHVAEFRKFVSAPMRPLLKLSPLLLTDPAYHLAPEWTKRALHPRHELFYYLTCWTKSRPELLHTRLPCERTDSGYILRHNMSRRRCGSLWMSRRLSHHLRTNDAARVLAEYGQLCVAASHAFSLPIPVNQAINHFMLHENLVLENAAALGMRVTSHMAFEDFDPPPGTALAAAAIDALSRPFCEGWTPETEKRVEVDISASDVDPMMSQDDASDGTIQQLLATQQMID